MAKYYGFSQTDIDNLTFGQFNMYMAHIGNVESMLQGEDIDKVDSKSSVPCLIHNRTQTRKTDEDILTRLKMKNIKVPE